jgi:ankyrin repeat protein
MTSQLSKDSKRPLTLAEMCPEILCHIADKLLEMNHDRDKSATWEWNHLIQEEPVFKPLGGYKDALNFAATCKGLYLHITRGIYRHDVRYNMSAALLISAKLNNVAGVRQSLDARADVHTGDTTEPMKYYIKTPGRTQGFWIPLNLKDQVTALHWAAYMGHRDIVSLLMQRGADINYRVRLDIAEWQNQRDSARLARPRLLDHYPLRFCSDEIAIHVDMACKTLEGIDPDIVRLKMEQGANPLYFAIQNRNCDMAEFLINRGASMNTHTGTRSHALHQAVTNCDLDMVKLILRYEIVDINSIRDIRDSSPLHYIDDLEGTAVVEVVEIIKTLVQHGASVNATDVYGTLPLKIYMRKLPVEPIVSEFIRHGSHTFEEFYLIYGLDPADFPEGLKSAFRDAEVRGFPLLVDLALPSDFAGLNALRLRYHQFYSLVEGTSVIPDNMVLWGDDEWQEYWEERPLVCTTAPRLGGLWDKNDP